MAHRLDIRRVKNSLRSGSSTISSRDDGSPRPSTSSAPTYTGSHRYEHSSISTASSARTRKGSDSPQVHKVTSRTLLSSPEPPSSPHKTEPRIPPFPTLLTVQARGRPRVSSHSFDLSPPPPKPVSRTTEGLAERLYSADHLRLILEDPVFSSRFTGFLSIYRPHCAAQLTQYLESQKARKAIEYANAIVAKLASSTPDSGDETVRKAAHIDTGFEQQGRKAFHGLVDEGLTSFRYTSARGRGDSYNGPGDHRSHAIEHGGSCWWVNRGVLFDGSKSGGLSDCVCERRWVSALWLERVKESRTGYQD